MVNVSFELSKSKWIDSTISSGVWAIVDRGLYHCQTGGLGLGECYLLLRCYFDSKPFTFSVSCYSCLFKVHLSLRYITQLTKDHWIRRSCSNSCCSQDVCSHLRKKILRVCYGYHQSYSYLQSSFVSDSSCSGCNGLYTRPACIIHSW